MRCEDAAITRQALAMSWLETARMAVAALRFCDEINLCKLGVCLQISSSERGEGETASSHTVTKNDGINPFGMSNRIKKGSQHYTEAEIFSDRRNSPIINTNMKTKNRGCWEKIYNLRL